MIRWFSKTSVRERPRAAWWQAAERAAANPTSDAIERLAADEPFSGDPDEAEQQHEMIDGLRRAFALREAADLPLVDTQHKLAGADMCHLIVPATLSADHDIPGKILLTSRRFVFAGGRVIAAPWHRIVAVRRTQRDLEVTAAGADPVTVRFNTFGDAIEAHEIAGRLRSAARSDR